MANLTGPCVLSHSISLPRPVGPLREFCQSPKRVAVRSWPQYDCPTEESVAAQAETPSTRLHHTWGVSPKFRRPVLNIDANAECERYVVKSNFFKQNCRRIGVPFYSSPTMVHREGHMFAPWGCVVLGTPVDKQWLRVAECYLPLVLDNKILLREDPRDEDTYVVRNSKLAATVPGIPFCRSPSIDDKDIQAYAVWGSVFRGDIVYGQGTSWLRIAESYMPMWLDGVPVIHAKNPPPVWVENEKEAQAKAWSELRPRTVQDIAVSKIFSIEPPKRPTTMNRSMRRAFSDACIQPADTHPCASPTHNYMHKTAWLDWPHVGKGCL